MELVPQSQQIIVSLVDRSVILFGQKADIAQVFGIFFAKADESDPANNLNIPQTSPRPLDVRVEQELGFTVFAALGESLLFDHGSQRAPSEFGSIFEGVFERLEEGLRAVDEPHLDQGRQDLGIRPSQLSALEGGPHGKSELKAGIADHLRSATGDCLKGFLR
jgi:hypothetical protein